MIYTFGNSHAHLFTNSKPSSFGRGENSNDKTTSYSIGPIVAFNFYQNHYPKILNILNGVNFNKKEDYIMLIVGEVDCRWHLPYQASVQNRILDDIVEECLERFFLSYLNLKNSGYKIIGWGGHPSTTEGHRDMEDSPIFGDCLNRNKISLLWNAKLQKKCIDEKISYISIIKDLINEDGMTKMEYFDDYCHLNYEKTKDIIHNKFLEIGL